MGRPLKIQQLNYGAGTTVSGSNPVVTTYNQNVTVDSGYPNWNSLTAAVYPSPTTMQGTNFLGVVGGSNTVDSATFPTINVRVRLAGQSNADGFIIRQKGSIKYLVASTTSVNDEDFVAGRAYYITSPGSTNWAAIGGPANAQVGDVFTATGAGSGTGTAVQVGVCSLVNKADGALAEGEMSITMSVGDSAATRISKLTNKYALDYSTPAVRYAINFFQDGGTTVKSGTTGANNTSGQQNLLTLAVIEQYNS